MVQVVEFSLGTGRHTARYSSKSNREARWNFAAGFIAKARIGCPPWNI